MVAGAMAATCAGLKPCLSTSCRPAGISTRTHKFSSSARRTCLASPQALFGKGKEEGGGGGGNPFGNFGNMMEKLKDAQNLVKTETARLQAELAQTEFEGFSKDETVRVVVSGNQQPKAVEITQEAYKDGPEALSQAVLEAAQEAHATSVKGMQEKMAGLAKSLGLPSP
ncbi:STIC2 [Auxenochlorella protothecoides x Auxenochlorella symbiontica]